VAHTRATAVSLLSCRALATPRRSTVKPARVRSVYVKSKRTCTREGVRVRVRARVRVKVRVRVSVRVRARVRARREGEGSGSGSGAADHLGAVIRGDRLDLLGLDVLVDVRGHLRRQAAVIPWQWGSTMAV